MGVMIQITVNMMQRLNLDALLSIQRGGLEDLFTLHDIREKVRVPQELRDSYVKMLPDGRAMLDEKAVELAESMEVELEKDEVRRLLKLFKEWANFTEGDVAWVGPLKKQLER
jgi:hypothetical protein